MHPLNGQFYHLLMAQASNLYPLLPQDSDTPLNPQLTLHTFHLNVQHEDWLSAEHHKDGEVVTGTLLGQVDYIDESIIQGNPVTLPQTAGIVHLKSAVSRIIVENDKVMLQPCNVWAGKQYTIDQYKDNIADLDINTENIYDLRPVSFDWKSNGKSDFGYIAEEVHDILPELVVYDGDNLPEANKGWESVLSKKVTVNLFQINLEDVVDLNLDANIMKPLLGLVVVE